MLHYARTGVCTERRALLLAQMWALKHAMVSAGSHTLQFNELKGLNRVCKSPRL